MVQRFPVPNSQSWILPPRPVKQPPQRAKQRAQEKRRRTKATRISPAETHTLPPYDLATMISDISPGMAIVGAIAGYYGLKAVSNLYKTFLRPARDLRKLGEWAVITGATGKQERVLVRERGSD